MTDGGVAGVTDADGEAVVVGTKLTSMASRRRHRRYHTGRHRGDRVSVGVTAGVQLRLTPASWGGRRGRGELTTPSSSSARGWG
jgi:hypothetical protein